MSEIRTVEDAHRFLAEYDAAHPYWHEEGVEARAQIKKREQAEARKAREAEEQASKARKAEKQQVASTDWYAAVDDRVRTHFKDWAWAAIDERIDELTQRWWKHEWDNVLKDAIGEALGMKAAQVRDEFKLCLEKQQCAFDVKLTEQKERFLALYNSADGAQGRAQLREEVRHALGEMVTACGAEIAALERRIKAVPGKLPAVKTWLRESVTYEGEVVSYGGASYQARRDTAQIPGGSDWVCVARAGHDAVTPNVRGAYDAHKTYARLDLVEYDGSSFIARRDAPGVPGIPGDGWQLMSRSGRRGATGETGPRGRKGERGAKGDSSEIVSWHLERKTYRAFPVFADGKMGPELNLRPLFEQFVEETSHVVE